MESLREQEVHLARRFRRREDAESESADQFQMIRSGNPALLMMLGFHLQNHGLAADSDHVTSLRMIVSQLGAFLIDLSADGLFIAREDEFLIFDRIPPPLREGFPVAANFALGYTDGVRRRVLE